IAMFESRSMKKRTISLNISPMKDSLIKAMTMAGIEITEAGSDKICGKLSGKSNVPVINKDENIFAKGIENCKRLILDELDLSKQLNQI
ncbi:MAG: hypothetical protein ABI528_10650, partial [bacterium]